MNTTLNYVTKRELERIARNTDYNLRYFTGEVDVGFLELDVETAVFRKKGKRITKLLSGGFYFDVAVCPKVKGEGVDVVVKKNGSSRDVALAEFIKGQLAASSHLVSQNKEDLSYLDILKS